MPSGEYNAPGFQLFEGKKRPAYSEEAQIKIRQDGYITFNKPVWRSLGNPTWVALLYDPIRRLIGLSPVKDSVQGRSLGYAIKMPQGNGDIYEVRGLAFLQQYGIRPLTTKIGEAELLYVHPEHTCLDTYAGTGMTRRVFVRLDSMRNSTIDEMLDLPARSGADQEDEARETLQGFRNEAVMNALQHAEEQAQEVHGHLGPQQINAQCPTCKAFRLVSTSIFYTTVYLSLGSDVAANGEALQEVGFTLTKNPTPDDSSYEMSLDFEFCLNCGRIAGEFPLAPSKYLEEQG